MQHKSEYYEYWYVLILVAWIEMGVVMCCGFIRFYPWLFKSQRILPYCEPSEFSSWQAAAPAGISDCTKQLTWPRFPRFPRHILIPSIRFYQILSDSITFTAFTWCCWKNMEKHELRVSLGRWPSQQHQQAPTGLAKKRAECNARFSFLCAFGQQASIFFTDASHWSTLSEQT